jgi:hypothetical protein
MPDWRATLRAAARQVGELTALRWRAPRLQPAPLVVLAEISGSMSRYSVLSDPATSAPRRAGPHRAEGTRRDATDAQSQRRAPSNLSKILTVASVLPSGKRATP